MNWKRLTAIIQSMTSMSAIGYNINILHNNLLNINFMKPAHMYSEA